MSKACEVCGSPAAYRVRVGEQEEAYCRACLSRRPEGEWLSWLDGFSRPRSKSGTCPNCGWTNARLEETGLVGCPLCYDALDRSILAGFAPKSG